LINKGSIAIAIKLRIPPVSHFSFPSFDHAIIMVKYPPNLDEVIQA